MIRNWEKNSRFHWTRIFYRRKQQQVELNNKLIASASWLISVHFERHLEVTMKTNCELCDMWASNFTQSFGFSSPLELQGFWLALSLVCSSYGEKQKKARKPYPQRLAVNLIFRKIKIILKLSIHTPVFHNDFVTFSYQQVFMIGVFKWLSKSLTANCNSLNLTVASRPGWSRCQRCDWCWLPSHWLRPRLRKWRWGWRCHSRKNHCRRC